MGELAAVMDMGNLEADDQPKAEAGNGNQGVTDNVDHSFPPLCLLLQFIHERDDRIGIRAFFGKGYKTLRVIHDKQLVTEDHPDGKGDDPDSNIDQQIGEQVSHSASH